MLNLLWKLGPQNPTKWIKKCVLLYRPKSSPKTTGLIINCVHIIGKLVFQTKIDASKVFEQFKKKNPCFGQFRHRLQCLYCIGKFSLCAPSRNQGSRCTLSYQNEQFYIKTIETSSGVKAGQYQKEGDVRPEEALVLGIR